MENQTTVAVSAAIPSAVKSFGLGRHDCVTIDGIDQRQVMRSDSTIVLQHVLNPDVHIEYSHKVFSDLVGNGEAEFKRNYFKSESAFLRGNNTDETAFGDLPPTEQKECLFIESQIVGVEKYLKENGKSLTEDDLPEAIAAVYAELLKTDLYTKKGERSGRTKKDFFGALKPSAFLRCRRNYIAAGRNPLALRDGRRARNGPRGSRIKDPRIAAFFYEWVRAYIDEKRPTKAGLYRLAKATFNEKFGPESKALIADGKPPLVLPSLSTFSLAVDRLDKFAVLAGRTSEKEARKTLRIVGLPEGALRPGERVLVDHWRVNLMTLPLLQNVWKKLSKEMRKEIKRIRLWLCVAMCEATRLPLGIKLSTNATAASARATLAQVFADKTKISRAAGCKSDWYQSCSPEAIATDGGAAFIELGFRASIVDSGAVHELGPAGVPEVRAALERFFRTLDQQLLMFFTGRTFEDITKLGDYPASERASVVADMLRDAVVRYLVDVYMNLPHQGLGGQTPADAWEEKSRLYGPLPPPSPATLRAIFGYTSTRAIGNRGLPFLGLHYNSQPLAELLANKGPQDVLIRVDLSRIPALSFREMVRGSPWQTAFCTTPGFENVSADEWIAIATDLRRKHAAAAALRSDIVEAALLHLAAVGTGAADLADLGPTSISDDEIEVAEKNLFKTFRIAPPSTRRRPLAALEAIEAEIIAPIAPVAEDLLVNLRPSRRRGARTFIVQE